MTESTCSRGNGGAIALQYVYHVSIEELRCGNNTAVAGGCVHASAVPTRFSRASFSVSGSELVLNRAKSSGGALDLSGFQNVALADSTCERCYAMKESMGRSRSDTRGGCLWVNDAPGMEAKVIIGRSMLRYNEADVGGAVGVTEGYNLTLTGYREPGN